MAYSVGFWNLMAKSYAKKPVPNETVYRHKLQKISAHLNADMSVFEMACGTGTTACYLAPQVADYKAIDVSPKMVDIARQRLRDAQLSHLEFNVSAIEEYVLAKESVDVALAMSVLHLLKNPEKAIEKLSYGLKPGGILVISSVCMSDRFAWMRYPLGLGGCLGVLPKVTYFSKVELLAMLSRAGFSVMYQMNDLQGTDAEFFLLRKRSLDVK